MNQDLSTGIKITRPEMAHGTGRTKSPPVRFSKDKYKRLTPAESPPVHSSDGAPHRSERWNSWQIQVFDRKENSLVARILCHVYSMHFSDITSGIVGKASGFWLLWFLRGSAISLSYFGTWGGSRYIATQIYSLKLHHHSVSLFAVCVFRRKGK